MSAFSYVVFHLVFVLPALVAVVVLWRVRGRWAWTPALRLGGPAVVLLAVVYTTPWDNYLIGRGVWSYGDGAVFARLWLAPVEEYAFFVLQTVLVAFWVASLRFIDDHDVTVTARERAIGVLAALVVGAVGLAAIVHGGATFYLGAILTWAAPVLAVQWAFGWPVLVRARRTLAVGVLAPTVFLSAADRIAIEAGVWTISPTYTTGVAVLGLPIEEGLFFLITTLFVVQTLVLLRWALTAPAVAVPAAVRRAVPLPAALREVDAE